MITIVYNTYFYPATLRIVFVFFHNVYCANNETIRERQRSAGRRQYYNNNAAIYFRGFFFF